MRLPVLGVGDVVVSGYLSNEFTVATMSPALAALFPEWQDTKFSELGIVFETKFQGDICVHRTEKLVLRFKVTPQGQGEAYFHLPMLALDQYCEFKVYTARQKKYDFAVMQLRPDYACDEIPIQF